MGRHSGWVSVGQWRGLASWVGFHVLARWATSCLTRIWVSKPLWSYLCSPDLLFEGDAKGREGFACAFMRVWVASFFSEKMVADFVLWNAGHLLWNLLPLAYAAVLKYQFSREEGRQGDVLKHTSHVSFPFALVSAGEWVSGGCSRHPPLRQWQVCSRSFVIHFLPPLQTLSAWRGEWSS